MICDNFDRERKLPFIWDGGKWQSKWRIATTTRKVLNSKLFYIFIGNSISSVVNFRSQSIFVDIVCGDFFLSKSSYALGLSGNCGNSRRMTWETNARKYEKIFDVSPPLLAHEKNKFKIYFPRDVIINHFFDDFNYGLECIGPKIYDDQTEHDELTFHVSVEMIDFFLFFYF